jgi:hypothetical protein
MDRHAMAGRPHEVAVLVVREVPRLPQDVAAAERPNPRKSL